MKFFLKFVGALVLLSGISRWSVAANTCQPSDMWCYQTGPSQSLTTVGRMDALGNLVLNGYETIAGSQTVTGNSGVTGNQVVSGTNTVTGRTVYSRSTQTGVTISSAINTSSTFVIIVTTSPNATIVTTAAPTLSTTTAVDGQFVVIKGTSSVSTYTFQDNGTLAGSLLELGAATRIVSDKKILTLIYDSLQGLWLEVSYANN